MTPTAGELWAILMTDDTRHIAGPWVPIPPTKLRAKHASTGFAVYRWSTSGDPLAKARSQAEVVTEDQRLLDLGYELTDTHRQIPQSWWDEAAVRAKEEDGKV